MSKRRTEVSALISKGLDNRAIAKNLGLSINTVKSFVSQIRDPIHRHLSARQFEVAKLMADGRETNEIAKVLSISVKTVSAHQFGIYRRLGVHKLFDFLEAFKNYRHVVVEEETVLADDRRRRRKTTLELSKSGGTCFMNRTEHLLTIVGEECNEVGQRASKAARFGLTEVQPGQDLSNRDRIFQEMCDLVGAYELAGLPSLDSPAAREMIEKKKTKVETFLDYSKGVGTLTE